jgi:hypothetical protein
VYTTVLPHVWSGTHTCHPVLTHVCREVETDEFQYNFTTTEKPHVQNDTVTLHRRYAQVWLPPCIASLHITYKERGWAGPWDSCCTRSMHRCAVAPWVVGSWFLGNEAPTNNTRHLR